MQVLNGDPACVLSSACIIYKRRIPRAHGLVHLDEDDTIIPSAIVAPILGVDRLHKHLKLIVCFACPGIIGPWVAHKHLVVRPLIVATGPSHDAG